jgi:dihydrofolate synthase/folylpolyglutamate synthase
MDVTSPHAAYEGLGAPKPAYQAPNITCAIALCESFLNRALDVQALLPAIATCPTPGRFDVVRNEPLGLVDACHNPQSVEAFLSAVRAVDPSPASRPTLLVAALADKDCASMVSLLAREFPRIVATQTNSPRALPAPSMAKLFRDAGVQVAAICPTVEEALEVLDGTPFVACGSITLAGAVTGYFARGPELRPQI